MVDEEEYTLLRKPDELSKIQRLRNYVTKKAKNKRFIRENFFNKTKLHSICIIGWWLAGWILYPYFRYLGKAKMWWCPKDPKLLLINYVLNYLLPVVDVSMDFIVGYTYYPDDPWYSFTTLSVIFLPALARLILETVSSLRIIWRDPQLFIKIWKIVLYASIRKIGYQLPFVLPFMNMKKITRLAEYKEKDSEAEEIALTMGSYNTWEPFLEAAPQSILQLYILIEKTELLKKPSVIWSLITSICSVSIAAGSTFLLERIDYPISNPPLVTKLFLGLLFVFVFIPRALLFAALSYLYNKNSGDFGELDKLFIAPLVVIIVLSLLIIFRIRKDFVKVPPKCEWNSKQLEIDADYEIKGEYQKHTQCGFNQYANELKWKSIMLSLFVPCIVIYSKSKAFKLNSLISTMWCVIATILGWILFKEDCRFGMVIPRVAQNITGNQTTECHAYFKGQLIRIISLNSSSAYINGTLINVAPLNWTSLELTNITCEDETISTISPPTDDIISRQELPAIVIAEAFLGSSIIFVHPFSEFVINLKNNSEIDEKVEAGISEVDTLISRIRDSRVMLNQDNGVNPLFFLVLDLVSNSSVDSSHNATFTHLPNRTILNNDFVLNTFFGSASFVASSFYNYISDKKMTSKLEDGKHSAQLFYSFLQNYVNFSLQFSANITSKTTELIWDTTLQSQWHSSVTDFSSIDVTGKDRTSSLKNATGTTTSLAKTTEPSTSESATKLSTSSLNESNTLSTLLISTLPQETNYSSTTFMTTNRTTPSSNETEDHCTDKGKVKDDALKYIFPVTLAFLLLSVFVQSKLSMYTSNLRLHRLLKKYFVHISLIGEAIEKEAEIEFSLEQKAKSEKRPNWRLELEKIYIERKKLQASNFRQHSVLIELLESYGNYLDLRHTIVTRRRFQRQKRETAMQMLKRLRWSQDYSPYLIQNILTQIATKGNTGVMKGSVDAGVDETEIFLSLKNNNLTHLYQLVQECQSLDMRNKAGETLLSFAILEGNYMATSLLLNEGASPLLRITQDTNAFQLACQISGQCLQCFHHKELKVVDAVPVILNCSVMNLLSGYLSTLTMEPSELKRFCKLSLSKELKSLPSIENEEEDISRSNYSFITILRRLKIIELLWIQIQQQEEEGHLFYQLCESGDTRAIHYFMENLPYVGGKKPSQKTIDTHKKHFLQLNNISDEGSFPLLHSLRKEQEGVAKLLLNYHKKINPKFLVQPASNGETVLMVALSHIGQQHKQGFIDIAKEIIQIYAEVDDGMTVSTPYRANALMYAARTGQTDIINDLLPYYHRKKKVTVARADGWNALMIATRHGKVDAVKALLPYFAKENKIDYVAKDEKRQEKTNAIRIATRYKFPEIAHLLMVYRYEIH